MTEIFCLGDSHEDLSKDSIICKKCSFSIYGVKAAKLRTRHDMCGGKRRNVTLYAVETVHCESPLETLTRLNITKR